MVETDDVALISFTSGTEGSPKGVILSHNNLADVVKRLNSLMQIDDSISEYIGVPVYHSFGFGRCRAVAMAGGQFFIPGNGFNPSEIGAMLKNGEINAVSAFLLDCTVLLR
ncbi:acyl--CoA ligase [Cyanobacteria bacterium FACHB-63]|nr:acyl--CoA ligase [Cyanobacteria bacterium FACHB-63]